MDVRAPEKRLKYMNGRTVEVVCPSNPGAMYHFQILQGYFPCIQNGKFCSHGYFGVRNQTVTALGERMMCYGGAQCKQPGRQCRNVGFVQFVLQPHSLTQSDEET